MRIFKLSIALFVVAFLAFACSGPGPAVLNTPVNSTANANSPITLRSADDLAEARKLYKEVCARCHQQNGEGGQVTIEDKTFKAPGFKQPSMLSASDADLAEVIEKGDDEMPAFGKRLSPQQIKDLVRMIRTDFQGK